MSDRDEFLGWVGSRLKDAETALHNGDAGPRFEIWSTRDRSPCSARGRRLPDSRRSAELFRLLADSFSDCTSYAHDVVAADVVRGHGLHGRLRAHQRPVNGEPRTYTLRATQVYRREDGEWKVAHRHADTVPDHSA